MTRINVGVEPHELPGKQLLAEHREMKRIPNAVRKGRYNLDNVPEKFTLGKGHVCFFYTRLGYLLRRYRKVRAECLRRGYDVTDYTEAWDGIPDELMGGYVPQVRDRRIILARLREKGVTLLKKRVA